MRGWLTPQNYLKHHITMVSIMEKFSFKPIHSCIILTHLSFPRLFSFYALFHSFFFLCQMEKSLSVHLQSFESKATSYSKNIMKRKTNGIGKNMSPSYCFVICCRLDFMSTCVRCRHMYDSKGNIRCLR